MKDLLPTTYETTRAANEAHYLRMLAVIASPISNREGTGAPDGVTLDVWGEWERLALAVSAARDPVQGRVAAWALVRLSPPDGRTLGNTLAHAAAGTPFHVVHVCSHGNAEGLVLEDSRGREQKVETEELVAALRNSGLQLVVLNACKTGKVAERLVAEAGIPCVIATADSIEDREGKLFAERLYGRLAAGQTVAEALAEARRSIIEAYERKTWLRGQSLLDLPPKYGMRYGDWRADLFQLFGQPDLRLRAPQPAATHSIAHLHPVPSSPNLPMHTVDGFVGRRVQMLQLAAWFEQTGRRCFAISGVGGMGKTALALNASLRNAWRFQAFVFASAKDNPEFGAIEVLNALNAVLGMTIGPEERDPADAIAARLNSRRVLLLLDNLESLTPERNKDLARAIRAVDPRQGSRVVMTLRPREHDPLTRLVEGRDRIELHELDWDNALHLAEAESRRQGIEWEALATSGVDAKLALAEIVQLSFRHPGLIKRAINELRRSDLAATRRRLRSLQGREVSEALTGFIGHMVDDLQQTSSKAVNCLYAAMTFAGACTLAGLQAVSTGEMTADEDALLRFEDYVARPAVDAMLLQRQKYNDAYELEPPVRGYLEKVRAQDGELMTTLRLRHARLFLPVAADWDDAIREGRTTYAAPAGWDDITAAWDWLCANQATEDAAAETLIDYSEHWRIMLLSKNDQRNEHWLLEAESAAKRLGKTWNQANVLQAKGDVLAFQKRNDEALEHYDNAFTPFQTVGDRLGQANVLKAKGDVLAFLDRRDEALEHYDKAFTLFQ
ncbi:MAG: CHAT domain-containing protein, partial [Caldilineales bacterium]|nr:CHAT domain-containing protein [Caldilineales bacterium]